MNYTLIPLEGFGGGLARRTLSPARFSPGIVDGFSKPAYHQIVSTHRVNIDQAREQLSNLVAAASEGGEVIIEENGKPLARLISATDSSAYRSYPPTTIEFAADDEALAWDAEGWESVA